MIGNNMNNKGFTLVEMIIAVDIFTVVMIVVIMSVLNISDVQQKTAGLRAINDNLNFGLEVMSREIKSGKDYFSVEDSLSFTNVKDELIVYKLEDNTIKRSEDGGNNFLQLTSSEIEIDKLIFNVNDGPPSMITIILSGWIGEKEKTKSQLHIQTTVSQRKI